MRCVVNPSSGDGGVDILVREGDGWHVRQVKGFTRRLDASRRRQVEASLGSVVDDPRLDDPVVRWTLAMPTGLSSGEQTWFDKLTSDCDLAVGLETDVRWDRLAARHPHVVDYYFENGRQRTLREAAVMLGGERATSLVTPAATIDQVVRLQEALNAKDPHFRYEFRTERVNSTGAKAALRSRPATLLGA